MRQDSKRWLTDPKFCEEFESEHRLGFRFPTRVQAHTTPIHGTKSNIQKPQALKREQNKIGGSWIETANRGEIGVIEKNVVSYFEDSGEN